MRILAPQFDLGVLKVVSFFNSIERNALSSRVKLDNGTDMGHKGTGNIQVLLVYVFTELTLSPRTYAGR